MVPCIVLIIQIYVYIQQDATLNSLFCLETALHVSGGNFTHPQQRKQLYLQHLVLVTHSTLKPVLNLPQSGREQLGCD
jgi:hypothetical protein